MNIIKWLNENAGAVQTFCTVVLVFVTTLYVWLTYRISRSSVRQALTAEQAYQADLQEKVGLVQIAASRILDLLTGFSTSPSLRHTVDPERWRQAWLELERAASAIQDEVVRSTLEEAMEVRKKWDWALTQPALDDPDEDAEGFRDFAHELLPPLARLASVFVEPHVRS